MGAHHMLCGTCVCGAGTHVCTYVSECACVIYCTHVGDNAVNLKHFDFLSLCPEKETLHSLHASAGLAVMCTLPAVEGRCPYCKSPCPLFQHLLQLFHCCKT